MGVVVGWFDFLFFGIVFVFLVAGFGEWRWKRCGSFLRGFGYAFVSLKVWFKWFECACDIRLYGSVSW
jgi:hypothetical protein